MPSIADLCQDLPTETFEPGEALIVEGRRSPRMFVLAEGTVEILKGDFQINMVSDPGAILGDMSVLLDIAPMATVRAVTRCKAHVTETGEAFLRSHPDIAYLLARMVAQRLHGVTSYLVDLKRQFEDETGHLGMVDEILETLLHKPQTSFTPGSDRDDPGY